METKYINNKQECLNLLESLKIPYKLYEHQPVFTMEDMKNHLKLQKSPLIKTLFFSDKKPNLYYMILALMDTKPKKTFWKSIGTTNNNVRMAKEEALVEVLRSKKGALNPFSLLNDYKAEIKYLLIDQKMYQNTHWAFHPMDNTATIEVEKEHFLQFADSLKLTVKKIDLLQQIEEENKEEKDKKVGTLLGLEAKKSEDFSLWYQDVIIKSGLIDYYDISGCYILRPWSFNIWERVQAYLDYNFKANGTENVYFPMFASKKALEIQKDHIEGFAPEVAWVTKSGNTDLNEPIAIRPTSQTIMYPAYANWIKSHRDLPLRLNQWTNIVRWEFKHPTPFIRTRQFLWQEGHTAHASREEAEQQMYKNLGFYQGAYQEMLAVPVMKGLKTASEKFPGGETTSTVETWIPENGRAIQAATSHNLGQNFAKMFQIYFEDEKKEKKLVWQTSWGFTTRSIGIMVMYHGDDKGLVIPPKVAQYQVVVIPILFKGKEDMVLEEARKVQQTLKGADVRVHLDNRDNYNPGWKYNHWELKGVPIRLEIGPKDIQKESVQCVIRHSGESIAIKFKDLQVEIPELLQKIQADMLTKAKVKFNQCLKQAYDWESFMKHLNSKNVVNTPWCGEAKCEEQVKKRSGAESKEIANEGDSKLTGQAKALCIPLEEYKAEQKCFHCGKVATSRVIWGRSY